MNILELLKVILIGIVEGITEWLPVSSTGHMIILNEIIKLKVSADFWEMFEVVIQLGAIMAVVVIYFKKLNPFDPKKSKEEKKDTMNIWYKVIVACLPAAVIGLLFDDIIDKYFYNSTVVAIMLILYGILFIVVENINKNKEARIKTFEELDYKTVLIIGVFQLLALIPGTSRSGATILGAIIFGTSRYIAAEFTFFLGIPVMFGASLLKIVKHGLAFSAVEVAILFIGMIVAFLVSVFAIKFLMSYIKKNDFKVFGYYRIALGIIVLIIFALFL